MRGATFPILDLRLLNLVSIRAPREGSDSGESPPPEEEEVSIRAPREGSDTVAANEGTLVVVSIRAPREGSDRITGEAVRRISCFNPRPP